MKGGEDGVWADSAEGGAGHGTARGAWDSHAAWMLMGPLQGAASPRVVPDLGQRGGKGLPKVAGGQAGSFPAAGPGAGPRCQPLSVL